MTMTSKADEPADTVAAAGAAEEDDDDEPRDILAAKLELEQRTGKKYRIRPPQPSVSYLMASPQPPTTLWEAIQFPLVILILFVGSFHLYMTYVVPHMKRAQQRTPMNIHNKFGQARQQQIPNSHLPIVEEQEFPPADEEIIEL
jgi:hypothetical protein